MRLLYTFEAEGTWFSKNGKKAYLRGEKPFFMWPAGSKLRGTCCHHIARKIGLNNYSRRLVMFYNSEGAR